MRSADRGALSGDIHGRPRRGCASEIRLSREGVRHEGSAPQPPVPDLDLQLGRRPSNPLGTADGRRAFARRRTRGAVARRRMPTLESSGRRPRRATLRPPGGDDRPRRVHPRPPGLLRRAPRCQEGLSGGRHGLRRRLPHLPRSGDPGSGTPHRLHRPGRGRGHDAGAGRRPGGARDRGPVRRPPVRRRPGPGVPRRGRRRSHARSCADPRPRLLPRGLGTHPGLVRLPVLRPGPGRDRAVLARLPASLHVLRPARLLGPVAPPRPREVGPRGGVALPNS